MSNGSQINPTERRLVLLLKEERLKQNLSATALAESIGVSRTTITHLENDQARPTLWVLLQIAHGLKLNLADFLAQASSGRRR
ncbi:helix-turn-helix domain-containing protein [Brevifollis gellanilyticus]|uniref:HTH cro/C1-type domain-containing protein n=1 Tax=Brevifollis gellanilyticus TaxID=748831 RepID=A0A512MGM5_9BACT|nr:hypothetical protein BGE01nite_51690 [Brevifollis gellanilyticus]